MKDKSEDNNWFNYKSNNNEELKKGNWKDWDNNNSWDNWDKNNDKKKENNYKWGDSSGVNNNSVVKLNYNIW